MGSSAAGDRIIVLVDMDCFYVQVEQKLCPEYLNKPCAVVQYKTYKGGGIIAVNYEARARGVTRMLRGSEAQEKCPDIHLFRVPEVRGKADLTRYREAGAKVIDVLCEFSDCVERASIDEAYLDMTAVITSRIQNTPPVTVDQLPNTFVIGWEGENPESRQDGHHSAAAEIKSFDLKVKVGLNGGLLQGFVLKVTSPPPTVTTTDLTILHLTRLKYAVPKTEDELKKWLQMIYEEEHLYNDRMLAVTAVIVEEMRTAVHEKTGYMCSAGIAHNKMLSKLSCGINKPNKQTVLPQSSIQILFRTIPIKKVRNLGGKLGQAIRKKFNAENMGDLIDVPKSQFVSQFGEKTGQWLYNLVRGIENEPVTSRQLPKSIGCGKNFPGKSSLSTKHDVMHWLKQLASELEERLIKDQKDNRRFARLLTISVRNDSSGYSLVSRSCPIHVYNAEKLAHDALMAISKLNTSSADELWKPSIYTLSMAASKFEDRLDTSLCNIQSYLVNGKNCGKQNEVRNKVESELSTSTASFSSESVETLNKTILKSSRSVGSSSITSFFARKQTVKAESVDNAEMTNTNNNNNNNQSCIQDIANCLVEEESNIDPENSEECDLIATEGMSTKGNLENSPKKDAKVLGFFAKNNIQDFSNCLVEESNDETVNTDKCCKITEENSSKENSEGATEKVTKPLGFFAKKLKEHSEVKFDSDFTTPSDNAINNEHVKENESTSANIDLFAPSTSSASDICSSLDPELTKVCELCHKCIPVWEEIEHLDYHMALDLSKEVTPKPVQNSGSLLSKSTVSKKSSVKSKGVSRKRGSVTKPSQSKKSFVQKNTLDAFIK